MLFPRKAFYITSVEILFILWLRTADDWYINRVLGFEPARIRISDFGLGSELYNSLLIPPKPVIITIDHTVTEIITDTISTTPIVSAPAQALIMWKVINPILSFYSFSPHSFCSNYPSQVLRQYLAVSQPLPRLYLRFPAQDNSRSSQDFGFFQFLVG